MSETELQRVYDYDTCPRDSILTTNKRFVTIDNGQMGGTHWTAFFVKNNDSFSFGSLGGAPEKF